MKGEDHDLDAIDAAKTSVIVVVRIVIVVVIVVVAPIFVLLVVLVLGVGADWCGLSPPSCSNI